MLESPFKFRDNEQMNRWSFHITPSFRTCDRGYLPEKLQLDPKMFHLFCHNLCDILDMIYCYKKMRDNEL